MSERRFVVSLVLTKGTGSGVDMRLRCDGVTGPSREAVEGDAVRRHMSENYGFALVLIDTIEVAAFLPTTTPPNPEPAPADGGNDV